MDKTRQNIDETLHKLEDRFSPGEMLERAVNDWGGGIKEFSNNFGRSMRDNPVPAMLLGVSLVWLMSSSGSGSSGRYGSHASEYGKRAGSGLRDKYEEMKSRTGETVGSIGEKVKDISEVMRHRGEHMQEEGREWKHKVQSTGSDMASRPLLLAAAGLALGMLAAWSLPITRKEEKIMGGKGEELLEKAEDIGRE
ncbi:MAG: hypothetical protein SCH71_07000 [Desulfobulbaceae bacterium]|nr:hypothetical protein [Desulfobulbaceae bacterium]